MDLTTKKKVSKRTRNSYFISPLLLQRAARVVTKPLFKVMLRKKVRGIENLKGLKGGVILAPNHTSYFDVALVPTSLPAFSKLLPVFYVSRPHVSYAIDEHGGFLMKRFLSERWGSFEYQPGQKDYAKTLATHAEILESGGTVCIFPEGGISQSEAMKEAKGGIAYLAYKTGKPVIPIKIEGAHGMTFRDLLTRKRTVMVTYGKPIYFSGDEEKLSNPIFLKQQASLILEKIKEL